MSIVTIAWLAVRTAPGGSLGIYVGSIVAGLGAGWTLTASGAATVVLAAVAAPVWQPRPSGAYA